jgi:hypothetical protein
MNLGTTLGTKGGLLDYFSSFLNLLTGISDALNVVFNLTGKVSPLLLAVGGVSAVNALKSPYARQLSAERSTDRWGRVFSAVGFGSQYGNQQIYGPINKGGSPEDLYLKNLYAQSMAQKFTGMSKYGFSAAGMLGALGITGASVLGNQLDTTSTDLQKKSRTIADIAGGIGGAILGTLLHVGPVLGSTIGISISEAFVNATIARDMDFKAMFTGLTVTENGIVISDKDGKTAEQRQAEALEAARSSIGGGATGAEAGAFAYRQVLKSLTSETVGEYSTRTPLDKTTRDIMQSIFDDALKASGKESISGKDIKITQDQMLLYMFKVLNPSAYKTLMELNVEDVAEVTEQTPLAKLEAQKTVQNQYKDLLSTLSVETNKTLLNKLITGDITKSEYQAGKTASGNFNQTLTSIFATVGKAYQTTTGKTDEQAMKDFAKIYAYSSSEQQDAINASIQEIDNLRDELSKLTVGTSDYEVKQLEVNTALSATVGLLEQYNLVLVEQIKLLSTTDVSNYTQADIDSVITRAQEITKERYLATLPEGEAPNWSEYQKTLDKFVGELFGGKFSGAISGTMPEDLSAALQEAVSSGTIAKRVSDIGFTSFDLTKEEFATNTAPYDQLMSFLTEQFGYKPNPEPSIVTFSDGTMAYMNKDWKIVQYLLSQILDTEQKQLETNLYNFPSGMTAYVPFSAVNTTLQSGGSGGGNLNNFLEKLTAFMSETSPITQDVVGTKNKDQSALLKEFREAEMLAGMPNLAYKKTLGERGRAAVISGSLGVDNAKNRVGSAGATAATLGVIGADNTKGGVTSKLNLDIKSTIYVQMDGRTMATAISRYLADKLVKTTNAGSSSVRVNIL